MKNPPSTRNTISIAQRAQIIQRVLVDGWTSAQAAAAFGLSKRLVDLWVADFRKNGMASLREPPGQTVATEMIQRYVRGVLRRISVGLRRMLTAEPPVEPLPLRRTSDDGPR